MPLSKRQHNAQLHRDFMLRQMQREFKHGYKDTLRTKTAAKEATRRTSEETLGGVSNAPSVRKDGDGN
jgi:hypothetical protein